jgi:hypothetical protein
MIIIPVQILSERPQRAVALIASAKCGLTWLLPSDEFITHALSSTAAASILAFLGRWPRFTCTAIKEQS